MHDLNLKTQKDSHRIFYVRSSYSLMLPFNNMTIGLSSTRSLLLGVCLGIALSKWRFSNRELSILIPFKFYRRVSCETRIWWSINALWAHSDLSILIGAEWWANDGDCSAESSSGSSNSACSSGFPCSSVCQAAAERKAALPLNTRKVHPNVQESDRKGDVSAHRVRDCVRSSGGCTRTRINVFLVASAY